MNADLRLGWAVDFMDEPFDNAEFRFWSGEGDLSIDSVEYRGTNGVISIEAPNETSGEATRMKIEMDASDRAVRQQLRRDIGPLRVRVKWLWYDSRIDTSNVNDGITILTGNLLGYWTASDFMLIPNSDLTEITNNSIHPWRFRSRGSDTGFSVGTTYYARFDKTTYGSNTGMVMLFDSEANATNAQGLPWTTGQTGRIDFTSNGTGVSGGTFDASAVRAAQIKGWTSTGKEFIGRLSSPVISGATYVLDVESQISDIDRGRVIDWSNDTQQQKHPADKGMEYLAEYAEGFNTKWPP